MKAEEEEKKVMVVTPGRETQGDQARLQGPAQVYLTA